MDVFEQIVRQFFDAISGWEVVGISIAKDLFLLLAAIQIIWSGALWMLNKDDPNSLFISFIKKILVISFFWAVLLNYDVWIPTIIDSLRGAGQHMAGTGMVTPTVIVEKGVMLATVVMDASSSEGLLPDIPAAMISILVAVVVFFTFLRIAIELILILIGGKIILAGGVVMLGFAGSQWTRNYAERYFSTAISLGIKMLFITLIVGLGESLSDSWANIIENTPAENRMISYFSLVAAALVYYFLAIKIPDMAASMLSSSLAGGLGAGEAASTARGATLATAGAVVATGGGVSAIRAAHKAGSVKAAGYNTSGVATVASTIANTARTLMSASRRQSVAHTTGGKIAERIRKNDFSN